MKIILLVTGLCFVLTCHSQVKNYANVWTKAPERIPNRVSVDAPLLGNGDIGISIGASPGLLQLYLSKNDFWRLESRAEGRSGPRLAGTLDVRITGVEGDGFRARQSLENGETIAVLGNAEGEFRCRTWVAATKNMVVLELSAGRKTVQIDLSLTAPANPAARLSTGNTGSIIHMTRSFEDSVDIPTRIAVALRVPGKKESSFTLKPFGKATVFLSFESGFAHKDPLAFAVRQVEALTMASVNDLWKGHNRWWQAYWNSSDLFVSDTVLMKSYYQGLYTMAACARDRRFAPGLFGWCTTDRPNWNGDYHLNYNFYAPFYALYGANRLEQAGVQEAALLDFMPRGRWYAEQVTGTRGLLYPVGIGPLGVDLTRDFPVLTDNGYTLARDVEAGGLFYMQRSNAVFGTVNMAQHWRTTYDTAYGRLIYPYILGVVEFWEDYLRLENGRYVIWNDAENEKSGYSRNPAMTLALLRNALDLMIDLSTSLNRDLQRVIKWKDILARLSGYPTDDTGAGAVFTGAEANDAGRKGRGASYSIIYPANGITLNDNDTVLGIARNTVSHIQRWQHENSTNSFYMAAIRVGYDREKVVEELRKYALHTYPNGFQYDNPHGIENAATVANALQEMFCMSVGNRVRFFPGWPEGKDASFENIRSWGAFLVSARLVKGIVQDIRIKSEQGRLCTVVNPWPGVPVILIRDGKKAESYSGTEITFNTAVSELIELKPLSTVPSSLTDAE